jgi:hypothetical protein
MFYLSKTDDIWTLSYEVSPIRHTFLIVAGVAGLGAGTFQIFNSSASPANWMSIALPGVRCVAMLGYWTMRDAATEAVFDLANRRIRIDSRRPLFGPARSFGFSEVAAIRAQSFRRVRRFMGSLHRTSCRGNDPARPGGRRSKRTHPKLPRRIRHVTGIAG